MPHAEKQFDWFDYWDVVVRKRWILLAALFVSGLGATLAAAVWPVRYRSQALILVEEQDVPSDYVRPNVTADARARLATISQQVLSRRRLEDLIDRYHLYSPGDGRVGSNKIIERMRKAITLVPVKSDAGRSLTALRIGFVYRQPRTAQLVTSDLTSEFINQSLQARTQASTATTDFLTSQLAQAQKELTKEQTQLSNLKTRYLGELPEQQQSNIQILSSLQSQLYAETNSRDSAQQQLIYLRSLASAYRQTDRAQAGAAAADAGSSPSLAAIDKTTAELRQKLTALDAEYTADYPDVVQAREQLAKWQTLRKAALAQAQAHAHPHAANSGTATASTVSNDPHMGPVQSRIKATQAEIAMHNRQIGHLKQSIENAEARLRLTPLREQQLDAATRNYQNAQQNYESLLQKKIQSELATNLERREEGERLQVLDPASLPQEPVEPNRLEIVLGGWVLGLAAGIGMVSAGEIADDTLRGDADLHQQIPYPVLAHVPVLRSPADERRRKWLQIAQIAAVVLLAALSAALGIYVCMVG